MGAWLKMIGTSAWRLEDDWLTQRSDLLHKVRFARHKRPSGVSIHDRLVYYAAGWEVFFGVAIVTSEEPTMNEEPGEERWPWTLDVVVPLVCPTLSLAPRLSKIGVASTSVRQQSHIELTDAQFDLAIESLTERLEERDLPSTDQLLAREVVVGGANR